MTYRDDLDALTARHATLKAEIARKQRELDEIAAMIAEAGRVKQAESYFERAPDLRRRQRRHLAIGALVAMLGSGAALGAGANAAKQSHRAEAEQLEAMLVRIRSTQAARAEAQRLRAELEALRALTPRLVGAPDGRRARPPSGAEPAWILGSGVAVRESLWTGQVPAPRMALAESAAGEDER